MNIICIDPSLTCTAVVINDRKFAFASENVGYTKTGKLGKWFEKAATLVTYKFHRLPDKKDYNSFVGLELGKINSYDQITDAIISTILSEVNPQEKIKIFIEGYSFSSDAGPLIDLVTFGTLLRMKFLNNNIQDITVIPPTELKSFVAQMVYQPVIEKKKEVWRNADGVAGGKFKKKDMMQAILDYDRGCEWTNFLNDNFLEIEGMASIPKPIEDINDAKLMYELVISNKYI